MNPQSRIGVLDVFRAIAVLWVAIYHHTYFWSSACASKESCGGAAILPFDDAVAWLPLADAGHLGVQFFFLISGYVILLTLQKTQSLFDFSIKRFARLWPPLMFCGTLTYLFTLTGVLPLFDATLFEFALSMMIFPPNYLGDVIGESWSWLDGAYWSLWAEVRFYAVIAIAYFVFRKHWLWVWLLFEVLGFGLVIAGDATANGGIQALSRLLIGFYAPYFTLGIVAFLKHQGIARNRDMWIAATVAGLHIVYLGVAHEGFMDLSHIISNILMFSLFGLFVFRPQYLSFMEVGILKQIGRSSYSFYLLHQVVGLSLIAFVANAFGATASLIAMPFVLGGLMVVAWLVFQYIEQPSNRWIVDKTLRTPTGKLSLHLETSGKPVFSK